MKKYRLVKTKIDDGWDQFVRKSRDSTIYSWSYYLNNTGLRLAAYFCLKSEEIRAAVIVVESDDGQKAIMDDLVVYSGVLMAPPHKNQSKTNQISEHFEINEFLASELLNRYLDVSFELCRTITDVRPFLWHNYSESGPKYNVSPRYTSIIDLSSDPGSKESVVDRLYAAASVSRRQQIRYAERDGVTCSIGSDAQGFCELYEETFSRQGQKVNPIFMFRFQNLVGKLVASKNVFLMDSYTSDGVRASSALFGIFENKAYYLFGANNPEHRNSSCGSAVIWMSIKECVQRSVKIIDLEGVNSPSRGWFKLSFGGNLVPYYSISTC